MLEVKYIEMIQADVDGELPEQHRAELSRLLLANPEARVLRDELRRTCVALDSLAAVDPPAGLRESILAAVTLPAPTGRSGGRSGLRGFWMSAPVLRYAAAFAGGLIVSALALQLGPDNRSGLDLSQVAGTMASQDPVTSSAPVDAISIDLEQVSGSARLFESPTMRVVEFDLAAREPVEVVVAHGGQEARFSGFGRSGAGISERYALVLDGPGRTGSPIEVKFFASGSPIHEDVLQGPESQ